MPQKIKNFAFKSWPYAIFIAISLIMLPTSFIYQVSPIGDINTMIAMGRAVGHGMIPFVNIFEQRGPYMYILHMVGLLPGNPLHWVYLLELINFYWVYKILIKIVELNKKITPQNARWYAVCTLSLILISPTLWFGASPEEFCFVPTTFIVYIIIKYFSKTELIPQKEIILIGIGFGWILLIKFATIGVVVGFFISYGTYLLFKKKLKLFFKTVKSAVFGLIIGISPALIFYTVIGKLETAAHSYFIENTGLSAYSLSQSIIKMLTILVPRLVFSSITLVILIFPLVIAYKKIKYRKNKTLGYILTGTFFIQIFMSLLIMRFLPTYGSISIMILISISAWAMPQLIFEFKSLKRHNQIFIATILALFMIIATTFDKGALIHLDTTFFTQKTTTLKNDASYIQGHIIKNNGGGTIESYANVPWSIYDSANEYPRLKYFDQTTIPYASQNIAGDKQYKYLKDKDARWVQILTKQIKTKNLSKSEIEQFIIKTYSNKKIKNSTTSINASIDAPIERAKKYPNQYYKIGYAKIKNTIFVISPIPKPLTSNYVLVDARYNISKDVKYYWKQNKLTGNDAYLLFTTKENAQKHHLKAIPIKTLE